MPRDIPIFGEMLVRVRGEPFSDIGSLSDLGLTVGGDRPCVVRPVFKHKDVNTDDFGPDVPAELLTQLAEVRVDMTLSHYDEVVLDACFAQSQGGGIAGVMVPAGTPMGGGVPVLTAGNHYITLNLVNGDSVPGVAPLPTLPGVTNLPWRFFTCVLTGDGAAEIPLGTKRSELALRWRVIPYRFPSADPQITTLVTTPLVGYPTTGGSPPGPGFIIQSPASLSGFFIITARFNAYNQEIEEDGFAEVTADPPGGVVGEVVSNGALLWDRQLQT